MDITETHEGAKAVAVLDGRLDTATAALTETRLLTMLAEKTRGNLDMTEADLLSEAVTRLREQLAN